MGSSSDPDPILGGSEAGLPKSVGGGGGFLAESGRVEAFSDGVLAIVITLLVLDLRPPDRRGEMLHELIAQWPVYVAYLASFGYVGVIWVNHHQLFTRIASVDTGLLWRNLFLLLTASVLPFPTAVLGSAFQHGSRLDETVGLLLYALVAAAMAGSWLLVFQYLSTNERLLTRNTAAGFFGRERRRALVGISFNVAVGLVGLWQPLAGLVIAATLPVFYALTSQGWSLARTGPRQP